MSNPLRWATNLTNRVKPPLAKLAGGWKPNYPLPAQYLNWWMGGMSDAAARLALAFYPHESDTPDLNVVVAEGFVWNGTTLTDVAEQQLAFAAPVTNPRIDRVVISPLTGAASIVAGAESATPVPPAIPAGKLPCAQVSLVVSQTEIVNADIMDERALYVNDAESISNKGIASGYPSLDSNTLLVEPAPLIREDNGINMRTKVIPIGDWNMDLTATVNIAHGIADWTKIRTVDVLIRDDVDTVRHNLFFPSTGTNPVSGTWRITSIVVELTRMLAEQFDNTSYDSTGYNRGWITVWYEV